MLDQAEKMKTADTTKSEEPEKNELTQDNHITTEELNEEAQKLVQQANQVLQ